MAKNPKGVTMKKTPKKVVSKKSSTAKTKKPTPTVRVSEDSNFLKAIYDNVGFGIVLFDCDVNILKINNALCQMLGYSEQEIQKLSIAGISHPLDQEKDQKLFNELLEGKRSQYQLEKRYLTKSGNILYGRLSVSIVKKVDGEVKELVAFVEDITEQIYIYG